MVFDLTFTDRVDYRLVADNREAVGSIVIGDFSETFFTALNIHSKCDYLRQWLDATCRLQGGNRESAIITSFAGHGGEILGWWWPMYLCDDGRIAVQNQLLHRDSVDTRFSIASCYDYIGPRNIMNDEGEPISEWWTTPGDLVAFATRVEGRLSKCG
jgi:hypothetical protein